MHEVFISYEHKSKSIADNMCASLERENIRCWYAPRDVIGDYATSIVNAINTCKVFVVILSEDASNSSHVLNEVEIAHTRVLKGNITIIPFRVSDEVLSQAMEYYVKRIHWIDAISEPLEKALKVLTEKINNILDRNEYIIQKSKIQRIINPYYRGYSEDEKENTRLIAQGEILSNFDEDVYNKLLDGRSNIKVLDLGSNDGSILMNRLNKHNKIDFIMGLDIDESAVKKANETYDPKFAKFYHVDIESLNFKEKLSKYIQDNNICSFDLVNMSMILLHLNNPFRTLKTIRPFLRKGGAMFIRDIDDGLNIAYPDPDNMFSKVFRLAGQYAVSSYRKTGRQVYNYLKKINANNIRLEKNGMNTIGMSFSEKTALFDTYFSWIPKRFEIAVNKYPGNEDLNKSYQWILSVYEELEEQFYEDNFFCSIGFMIYTAEF